MMKIELNPDDRDSFVEFFRELGVSQNDRHALAIGLMKISEVARNYQIGHELYKRGLTPPPGRRRHSEKICKILEETVAVMRRRNAVGKTTHIKEA